MWAWMKSDRFARRTMVCAWAVLLAAWALQADMAFAGAADDPAGSTRLGEALLRIDVLRAELDQQDDASASADAWNELAWLEYRYGRDNDAALEAAEKACSLNPSHFKAHELAGRLEYFVGHRDRVLDHWLRLLGEDRPEVELYLFTVLALAVPQAQLDAAIERLSEVEQSHPNPLFVALAGRLLAECALRQGRFEAAERGFVDRGPALQFAAGPVRRKGGAARTG